MTDASRIPERHETALSDRWNLSSLFASDEAWEDSFSRYEALKDSISGLKGSLSGGIDQFLSVLTAFADTGLLEERLGYYAHLRVSEDEGFTAARGRFARFMSLASMIQGEWSWLVPELQTLDPAYIDHCLADPRSSFCAIWIRKQLRFKAHVLGPAEEKLLALQSECLQTPQECFSLLSNVDMEFGMIETEGGLKPLTQSTYASFLRNKDREVRKQAYSAFYGAFNKNRNTIASLYSGSVRQDKYLAHVRQYASAREMALFPDNVPVSVYDNLVSTVNANLPVLHDYYALRKEVLHLSELKPWDVSVPLVEQAQTRRGFEDASRIVCEALSPLGEEYVSTLRGGLSGGWVDRYENRGKRSGAFSAGSFAGDPYILMNYKEDVLRDLFTLAHEGGHSMHSWYSARSNPFLSYNYTIFEAEVASTFNEQLVFKYLVDQSTDGATKASLLNNKIDDLIGTLFRQTMFAEFEMRTHAMVENGQPLTADSLRAEYRDLLVRYFGPEMKLEECSDLECLRIPHFYNAFYVYKYATGISASIALARRVLAGGDSERNDYFAFLRSGGSMYPMESLARAGVDMSSPSPIQEACAEFAENVAGLRILLGY